MWIRILDVDMDPWNSLHLAHVLHFYKHLDAKGLIKAAAQGQNDRMPSHSEGNAGSDAGDANKRGECGQEHSRTGIP